MKNPWTREFFRVFLFCACAARACSYISKLANPAPARRTWGRSLLCDFYCTCNVQAPVFSSSRAWESSCPMRTAPWRGHLRPKSPPRRVPWPYGVWHSSRVLSEFDCFVSLKHSFLKRTVANRTARSRYSVLYVLIYMGDRLVTVADRKNLIAHRSDSLHEVLMRKITHQSHTAVGKTM